MACAGSCLCGQLRYEVDGPFAMMISCHCSICRKHHGAPFATFAAAPLEGFRWISGADTLVGYESSPGSVRSFCPTCGSVAPLLMPHAGLVIVAAGTLDDDPGIRPQAHMFVGSKASWHEITDALPKHETFPPELAGTTPAERPSVTPVPGKTLGSCLCGEVAYEIEGAPKGMFQCHCSRCRKGRSAAHGANLFYDIAQFHWTRGEANVVSYKVPEAARFTVSFCKRCGGATPTVSTARGIAIVPAGALDTDPGMKPAAHIFVGSKAPWFEITGPIPQVEGMPRM